jgi:hypothetical protein
VFRDRSVRLVKQIGQHGETFLYLLTERSSGRPIGSSDIRGDAGDTTARFWMIPMPLAEVAVDKLCEALLPSQSVSPSGPSTSLDQGAAYGFGTKVFP